MGHEDSAGLLHRFDRWLYRRGRPNGPARMMNRQTVLLASAGLGPRRVVTLEVTGRRTGRRRSLPLVVADLDGEHYLVAMLGRDTNWVRNVRAADGRAVLRHGRRTAVRLEEVESADRAPVLRRYLALAPGARPHLPVDRHAPPAEFKRIAEQIPVFRIRPDRPGPREESAP
ncbi:nitroreductase family deazaflavin-dependent oxidoreductase [Streptomyces sp. NPDC101225]|uniref:nitroreductase family deazaflavin-dependent oxidoreductase n=1 Tax=Streptomyces sp. NPDC101225 TaxID=3366135 RepID=UPI003809FD6B